MYAPWSCFTIMTPGSHSPRIRLRVAHRHPDDHKRDQQEYYDRAPELLAREERDESARLLGHARSAAGSRCDRWRGQRRHDSELFAAGAISSGETCCGGAARRARRRRGSALYSYAVARVGLHRRRAPPLASPRDLRAPTRMTNARDASAPLCTAAQCLTSPIPMAAFWYEHNASRRSSQWLARFRCGALIYHRWPTCANQFSASNARSRSRAFSAARRVRRAGGRNTAGRGSAARQTIFSIEPTAQLCQAITIDTRVGGARWPPAGVHLCRIFLEYNPTWSTRRASSCTRRSNRLLVDLEYFTEIGFRARVGRAHLRGRWRCAAPARWRCNSRASTRRCSRSTTRSTSSRCRRSSTLASARSGARRIATVRPAARRLSDFTAAIERPCLAAHVRRTDHWRLARDGRRALLAGDRRLCAAD